MAVDAGRVPTAPADLARVLLTATDEQSDGLLVVDPDGVILHANRAFGSIWGIDADVLGTRSDEAALEAVRSRLADPEAFFRRVAELYADPDAEAYDEIRLLDERVLERRTVPLREGGEVIGRGWFFRDVTDDRRRQARTRFLAESAALLAGSLEYERLADTLAKAAVPALADWCAVDVVGEDGAFHRLGAAHVDPDGAELLLELDRRYPLRASEGRLRGRVLGERVPVSLVDAGDDDLAQVARDAEHVELLRRLGVRYAWWIPLEARERILGVLSFGTREPRADDPGELLALGRELAGRAALALDNARTYRTLRDREAQQAVVASLGQAALGGIALSQLFERAVESLAATLRVEYAKVLELQPGGAEVKLLAGVGWQEGLVGTARVPTDLDSQAGYTLLAGTPVIVEDLETEQRFRGPALLRDHGVRSGMSVVIQGPGAPWGVLGIHTRERRTFTPDDVNFMLAVANVLAEAIERRRHEDAVRDRDHRLELTLAASETGTWEWDVATGALVWSDEISVLHGLAPGVAPVDFAGYLELVHPDDRDRFQTEVERAVREGVSYDLEYRIVWPNGTTRWTNGVGRVFFDDAGHPVRMFGIGRDITARKEAERERDALLEAEREANALRDAFIGVLSHELRTPITTIYGGVKMLARSSPPVAEETRHALLADVEAEADHLQRLVEDLLVISRAERGRIELGEEPVQLFRLARRVAAAEQARWPHVEFSVEPCPPLPVARGDETSIEQVIRNLLSNAAKYSPAGTKVLIAGEEADGEIQLRVLDEGHGVSEDEADRLFQLFYRSPTTARTVSGAGIGLFVSRRLIEAMGGRIWARPRSPRGSEFGFALRRYEAD